MVPSEREHIKNVYNYADSFLCTYVVSVIAASIAEVVTYPLDLTKTRLQIQGEKAQLDPKVRGKSPYRGMVKTGLGIAQEEGILKLWRGVTPAIYRHVIYSGIRIVTYESIRDKLLKKGPNGQFPIWKAALGGVTAGAIAQFIASPTDLVKVQIQMEGRRRLQGKPPRVHGMLHAFQKILAEGGVRGLWKGSIPNVQRAALVNLGDLTTYDSAKRFILTHTSLPDNSLTHMLSSGCAGLVAATMGTPADVVKTRVMNQPTDSQGRNGDYICELSRVVFVLIFFCCTNIVGDDKAPKEQNNQSKSDEISKTSIADRFWCRYIISAMAACIAELATFPLDTVKTHLQIQGERVYHGPGIQAPQKGMRRITLEIIRDEGVFSLWNGVSPALYRHVIYSGIRVTCYEALRDQVLKKDSNGQLSMWKAALAGAAAGCIGQFVANPTDVVKIQMQLESKRRLEGQPPRTRGVFGTLKKIFVNEGIPGLWRGWIPNIQRSVLVNLGDFTAYDMSKRYILNHTSVKDGNLVHILAGCVAGLVGAVVSSPSDVLKSRIMNQPSDEKGRGLIYKSTTDCLVKTVQNEGFLALYKGFIPVWMRLGPWALIFWVTYETSVTLLGGSAF